MEKTKRYLLLCVGLAIMAFGVAFSIKGGLGTSPIYVGMVVKLVNKPLGRFAEKYLS
jgi:uncharacterized membrane protein YczE